MGDDIGLKLRGSGRVILFAIILFTLIIFVNKFLKFQGLNIEEWTIFLILTGFLMILLNSKIKLKLFDFFEIKEELSSIKDKLEKIAISINVKQSINNTISVGPIEKIEDKPPQTINRPADENFTDTVSK